MKYRNRIIAGILVLAAIFAALYFIPLRRNVDISMPCVIWDADNPTVGENEGIAIKGRYYDYLLKEDRFMGTVQISELNIEDDVTATELQFRWEDIIGCKRCSLFYWSRKYKKTYYVGSLFMQGIFDKVVVSINNERYYQFDGKYLCAPAATVEEAVAIAKEMNLA